MSEKSQALIWLGDCKPCATDQKCTKSSEEAVCEITCHNSHSGPRRAPCSVTLASLASRIPDLHEVMLLGEESYRQPLRGVGLSICAARAGFRRIWVADAYVYCHPPTELQAKYPQLLSSRQRTLPGSFLWTICFHIEPAVSPSRTLLLT